MTALYDAMEELREMGQEHTERCEHPRTMRGLTEAGIGFRYVCDVERGGCGVDLGPVGAKH